jgi:FlaG/FlaF family flagellin (archaellin)
MSPIIASLLLIALTVIMGAVVLWSFLQYSDLSGLETTVKLSILRAP